MFDEFLVADRARLVSVHHVYHALEFRLGEHLADLLEDLLQLRSVDLTVTVLVELEEASPHGRFAAMTKGTNVRRLFDFDWQDVDYYNL